MYPRYFLFHICVTTTMTNAKVDCDGKYTQWSVCDDGQLHYSLVPTPSWIFSVALFIVTSPGFKQASQQDKRHKVSALWGAVFQLLVLKRVAECRRKALTPRLFVQQHQILHISPFVPPSADLYSHFSPLKSFEGLFGSHGFGSWLITPVSCPHVNSLTANLTHVAFLLCAGCGETCNVLQWHKHTGQGLFTRLHTAPEYFKMVQVGAEAPGRHQLPRHCLVEAVEEGLVLCWGLGRRSWFLTHRPSRCPPSRSTVELIRPTFGFLHTAVSIGLCKRHNRKDSDDCTEKQL